MISQNYSNIYFIGIGGIGMSALARYFNAKGKSVAGYDKTESPLTINLENEGISVHYEDLNEGVKSLVGAVAETLVVVTPAVPHDLGEWQWLERRGYTILKRAAVLGKITEEWKTLAVAGSHGKTTTSTMLAHVLSSLPQKTNAFLGGISANFNSNLLIEPESPWMVVEADEYDRSFHQLKPFSTIITSTDADHLDIYQSKEKMAEAYDIYAHLIHKDGKLIAHRDVRVGKDLPRFTYGLEAGSPVDFCGLNVRVEEGKFMMDVQTASELTKNVELGLPGIHNAENALAVIAMCASVGIEIDEIRAALASFKGVKRRFEMIARKGDLIYIDDYAHHPTAINYLLESIRLIYKDTPICIVFQPHLYSRTQDFMNEFAASLSKADEVILMPIYPARELPIDGITSDALATMITSKVSVKTPEEVIKAIKEIKKGILLTVGAGNIDRIVEPIRQILS